MSMQKIEIKLLIVENLLYLQKLYIIPIIDSLNSRILKNMKFRCCNVQLVSAIIISNLYVMILHFPFHL